MNNERLKEAYARWRVEIDPLPDDELQALSIAVKLILCMIHAVGVFSACLIIAGTGWIIWAGVAMAYFCAKSATLCFYLKKYVTDLIEKRS